MSEPADEHAMRELRDQLQQLQERVDQLEDLISQNIFEVVETQPAEVEPDLAEQREELEETAVIEPKIGLLATKEISGREASLYESPLVAEKESKTSSFSLNGSWESMVGGRWMTWLGSGSLIMAVLFFAFWAWRHFDTPAWLRVSLFHLAGVGFLAGAHWLNTKQLPRLSRGIAGLGSFTLYVAAYFMHHHYHLWGTHSAAVSFIDCILITLVTIGIALNANSVAIVLLGALGGYLTPLLSSVNGINFVTVFVYLAFLNTALIACAIFRPWQFLKPIVVAATVFMFLGWINSSQDDLSTTWSTEWLLVLHAAIILLGTTLPPILWRQRSTGADLLALVTNSMWFVGTTWLLFHRSAEQQLAAVCFGMTALHTGLFAWTLNRVSHSDRMPRYQLALGTMFLTLAIPLQMENSLQYLAFAWAIEGVAFAVIAVYFRDKQMARSSQLVLGLALFRTFAYDFFESAETIGTTSIDRRFLVLFFTSLALMVAGSCYWWVRKLAPPRDAAPLRKKDGGILIALGNVVMLISFTFQWEGRTILVLWTVDAAIVWLAALSAKHMSAQVYAFLLSVLMVGWQVVYLRDTVEQPFQLLLNGRFGSLVLVAAVYFLGAWRLRMDLPNRDGTELDTQRSLTWMLHFLGNAVLISAITMEVHYHFVPTGNWARSISMAEQVCHSVVWAVYAAFLVAVGFWLKYRLPRMLGLLALLGVVAKIFFVDLASLSLIYRVLALSILGVLLLVTSFWYQKFTARIDAVEP